jgi:hypothetical protein
MSQITGTDAGTADLDENNSLETLDTDDSQEFDGDDEGGEIDNSTETDQEAAFDPSQLTDPQLQAAYRQMQSFTPRLQEAAQIRQQYGDLDPGVVAAVREYQQLLQTDPYAARQFLAQQQQYLDNHLGTQQPADPFEGVEPLTDTEATLVNIARQLWQDNQQFKLTSQQSQFRAHQEAQERTFGQLEAQYKTQIPLEDKQRVQQMCQQTGCQDVAAMWKALNFDKAEQRGADKASRVVQKKQKSPTPPTNRQQRSAAAPSSGRKGLEGHFEDAWNQFNA